MDRSKRARAMKCAASAATNFTGGISDADGILLSDIQKTELTNCQFFYLRVPSGRALHAPPTAASHSRDKPAKQISLASVYNCIRSLAHFAPADLQEQGRLVPTEIPIDLYPD